MDHTEELTDVLVSFYNEFTSWENSIMRGGELTVSELHAIEVLGTYGPMNMKTLSQKLGVTTGTTTVTVDRLEKKEYAVREIVKEDRRVFLITLTEKGKNAFKEHHQYHVRLTEQIVSGLTEDQTRLFLDILKKINKETF
jgi:DNA-binding MarR family transcriptional regulator